MRLGHLGRVLCKTALVKKATIYDVAREAGVSHQTVTRYLSGFSGIRPETRERVRVALDGLNYRANSAARFLRSQQTNRIGILAHRLELAGPARAVAGATRAARDHGYVSDIVPIDGEDVDDFKTALQLLLDHQIAGLFATIQTEPLRAALEAVSDGTSSSAWSS
jgi:DNA-binding LacI/PurR family transcriptional regulator